MRNKEQSKNKKGEKNPSDIHWPQRAECKSCFNTKHYVCAFVTQRAVIPQATNRKYPSERMKLGAVSRGCCGRIRWCRLAYLSQKAASAVQKRGGWCHQSAARAVTNGSTVERHTLSLWLSAVFQPYFFPPCRFLVFVSHENVILHPPKKKGRRGCRISSPAVRSQNFFVRVKRSMGGWQ